MTLAYQAEQFMTLGQGHPLIGDDDMDLVLAEQVEGLQARSGQQDVHVAPEGRLEGLPVGCVIIHVQHRGTGRGGGGVKAFGSHDRVI